MAAFLSSSAFRRADELNRLRGFPNTPARTARAGRARRSPACRPRTDTARADDETGSITQPPAATIPIDIGEPSAIELPVAAPEEKPPVIRVPVIRTSQQVKSRHESRIEGTQRARRAKAAKPNSPAQFDLFQAIFGDQNFKQPPAASAGSASR